MRKGGTGGQLLSADILRLQKCRKCFDLCGELFEQKGDGGYYEKLSVICSAFLLKDASGLCKSSMVFNKKMSNLEV